MSCEGTCGVCRFSVDYIGPEGPRTGWAAFWMGKGVDPETDWHTDLYWDIRKWDEKTRVANNLVQCRLLPEFVQKRKVDWCSHFEEALEKA